MMRNRDIKVKLLNPEEVKGFVRSHGEFACVCYDTDTKFAERVGKTVLEDGHLSGSRANFFKFEISNLPRYTVDQVVRHEAGVIKNVQSQRYVDMNDFEMYATSLAANDSFINAELEAHKVETQARYRRLKEYIENDLGLVGEEANDHIRTILPIGCESKFNVAFSLEALIHFMHLRLCRRADDPIRALARKMKKQVVDVAPIYADYLVPKCVYNLFCDESKTCLNLDGSRLYPTREELVKMVRK